MITLHGYWRSTASYRVRIALGLKGVERRPVLAMLLQSGSHQALLLDALEAIPLPPPVAFQLCVARDVHPGLFQSGDQVVVAVQVQKRQLAP